MASKINQTIIKRIINLDDYLMKILDSFLIKENNGLHPKHYLTKYYQFFVDNVSTKDKVLDIGCGNGFVTSKIAEKAKKVVGIDLVEKNVQKSRGKYSSSNLKFILGDATRYSFKNKYDVIVLSNVLEHIDKRINFLLKINKLADKFLIRVPMIDRHWLVYYKREKELSYLSDKTHFTEYTLDSFKKEIKTANLKIESYKIKFGEIWAVVSKR